MRKETRLIIEHKKYKTDISEYLIFGLNLLLESIVLIIGIALISSTEVIKMGIGLIVTVLILLKIYYSFKRFGQLNKFEIVNTDLDKETCYSQLREISKAFNTKKIDWYPKEYQIILEIDDPNLSINSFYPTPFSYWLTIVIQDKFILVNERPMIFNLLLWFSRSQIKKLKRLIKTAANNG